MLNQKMLMSVIGVLSFMLIAGYTYTNYKIKNKEKEIEALNLVITNKNLEIQSLKLNEKINKETNELGIRLSNGIIVDLDNTEEKYTQINNQLYKSIEKLDKEDNLGISKSVIDSIWVGYEALR